MSIPATSIADLPCALTIAGSDSGGGAGIQADLKTFAAHRVHGLSAIAALTAQNTRGVSAVNVPPVDFLREQIAACFDDFGIGVVKLGMLATQTVIEAVADELERRKPPASKKLAIVLDPVMVATSGAKLLQDDALDALRTRLLPLADIATPNLPEAELLLGHAIASREAMRDAAHELRRFGAKAVLLKGGHLQADGDMTDVFADEHGLHEIVHPRLRFGEAHGTGCTLASAIAANLCGGATLQHACIAAADYVHRALRLGYRPAHSDMLLLDHFGASPFLAHDNHDSM